MRAAASVPLTGIGRPLSPLERWYWICDQISALNVISRAEVRGRVSFEALRAGLDALQRRHPLLRVAIETDADGANPRYVPRNATPIPLHQAATPEGGWERRLNDRELNESVDWRTGPLARAIVLSNGPAGQDTTRHDLVLVLPHCIADGTTVLTLMRQWIELAAELDSGSGMADLTSEPVRPAPENMFPARHRGAVGAAKVAAQLVRDNGAAALRRPRRLQATTSVPFEQRRTRLLHRELSGDELDILAHGCRREGTTVHGVLAAAMVTAVAEDAGDGPQRFTIGSPIDIRPELVPPVSGTELGTYVATVPSVVQHHPGQSLWPMARTISKDLVRRRRRGEPLSSINLLRLAAPKTLATSGRFLRFMDEKGPITLCLSNVGRVDFPDTIGPWQISGAQFIASLSVNALFVATVNSCHGGLAWNFTHVNDAVPDARAQRMADRSVEAVRSLINSSPA